jgi:pectate lyase
MNRITRRSSRGSGRTFTLGVLCAAVGVQVIAERALAAENDPNAPQCAVVCRAVGAGKISVEPDSPAVSAGQLVTLTAEPNEGWDFVRWAGDVNGVENPISTAAQSDLHAVALFANADPNAGADEPVGFAAVPYESLSTTTGGLGGEVVVVTTGEQLRDVLLARKDSKFNKDYPALNVVVLGKLTFDEDEMVDVKETYNVSIIGAGPDAVIEGFGLHIYKSFNIIVRNIEFRDCPDDAIGIEAPTVHHIWIDHCTLSDWPDIDPAGARHDGLVDIKHGAWFITVSWNHFANHHKTCLLGHSDNNAAEDAGRLKVTYHHNWFDNTYSRHPRVRFGECHVFNNYYDNSAGGMDYGIASTEEADLVVEANYFRGVAHPTHCGYEDSGPGDLVEFNNVYDRCGPPETRGAAFDPTLYYRYVPDDPQAVPALLIATAGAGKTPVAIPVPPPKDI